MNDNTPPKSERMLFGLLYDQLVAVTLSLIASTQLYTLLDPIPFCGHELRSYLCLFIGMMGPAYCFVPRNKWAVWLRRLKQVRPK